uniref:Uncharacterized protein n=1 Tax=Anguilla anguilla TaxID=7936 RepID=A0A0E9RIS0_ANGAN
MRSRVNVSHICTLLDQQTVLQSSKAMLNKQGMKALIWKSRVGVTG